MFMRLIRKCFSESKPGFFEKVKNKSNLITAKTKQGFNYVKTHTVKDTATEIGKGIKKGSKAVWNYTKKNPDEAIVLAGSYTVPAIVASKLKKAGKTKAAGLVLSTAALPIGEGYIAAKKGIQAAIKKKKENKNDNKA